MTRRILPLALLILAIAALAACSGLDEDDTGTGSPSPASTEAAATSEPTRDPGESEHDGDRAMEHIEALAGDLGVRVSGTPGESGAIDYISAVFEEAGYDVEVMDFTYESPRRFASVDIDGRVEVLGLAFEGSAASTATGEAVYVGLADTDDLEDLDLEGAVAVADRGTLTFREKYENVVDAGAVALVVINSEDEFLSGDLGLEAEIPVAGLDPESGESVLDAADNGSELTVMVGSQESYNVIARPEEDAHCEIIVGGHHDTVPAAPGAHDNASGTANVLELARAFAADGLDEGLCFATFGAEENGLNGSQALVDRLLEDDDLPEFMVNLDVTGIGLPVQAIGDEDLQDLAVELAESLGIDIESATDPPGASSDHASFAEAGVPVIFLASSDFAVIHTPADTVDKIEPETLDAIGDLAYAIISELLSEAAR